MAWSGSASTSMRSHPVRRQLVTQAVRSFADMPLMKRRVRPCIRTSG
jgi:hypothetical protein